jgi:hypothetical protein
MSHSWTLPLLLLDASVFPSGLNTMQLIDDAETRLRHYPEALEYDASREHAVDYITGHKRRRRFLLPSVKPKPGRLGRLQA